MTTLSDFSATDIRGREKPLSDFADKVVLIVNTASKCGFTPQYDGLEKLQKDYESAGFTVLGFPCNQFMSQEPGSDEEVATFCSTTFDVTFPMFGKVDVNGPDAHPLYNWLKDAAPGLLGSKGVKWNFTKFLLDRSGKPVERFAPTTDPKAIAPLIEKLLGK